MHEPLVANAALPAPVRICGFELKPYSLGHELWLIREKSPFLFGGKVEPGHIFEAILICTSTFEQMRRLRHSYTYLLQLWLVKRRVRKAAPSEAHIQAEADRFSNYQREGSVTLPHSDTVRPGRDSGRDPGTPVILRLHQFLTTTLRLSQEEAWDYPVGLARMQWAAYYETKGLYEVKNWFDCEVDRLTSSGEEAA